MFSGDEEIVVAGTVGPNDGTGRYAFTVERWFKGGGPSVVLVQSAEERFADGQTVINTCGLMLDPGDRMLLAATRADRAIVPNSCMPNGRLDEPEGQALLAAAEEAFGPGAPPATDPPEIGVDPAPPAGIDIALLAVLVGAVLASFALFGLTLLTARRQRVGR